LKHKQGPYITGPEFRKHCGRNREKKRNVCLGMQVCTNKMKAKKKALLAAVNTIYIAFVRPRKIK